MKRLFFVMATHREELWKTLQDLEEDAFRHFKWFLKQDGILEDFQGIPASRLEKAERQDTVDLMVQQHQEHGALRVTLKVLEKINRNDLVQRLKQSTSIKDLKKYDSVPLRDHERKKAETKMKLMIQERQMKVEEIRRSAELSRRSADIHIAASERVFTALLQSAKRIRDQVIEEIHEKQKTTQKEADEVIQRLEQEISELSKRSDKMEQLDLLCAPTMEKWTEVTVPPPSYGTSVGMALIQLHQKLSSDKERFIAEAKLHRVQLYAKDVTLDPDSANPHLVLSDDGKQVYCGDGPRNVPDSPERFNTAVNVLGKQSFSSGRFYYEVRVGRKTSWTLGVVKESINRKGSIKPSPENGYWTVCSRDGKILQTSARRQTKTVGVFVDYEKRSVSFHDVDSADVIHRLDDCSFTEGLYPFFSPGTRYGGKNSEPLIISPVSYSRLIGCMWTGSPPGHCPRTFEPDP